MYSIHRTRKKRDRSVMRGGHLMKPNKITCEKLFLMKGDKSWKNLKSTDKSWKSKFKYSLCKRSYKKLYQSFKNSKQVNNTKKAPRELFKSPRLKGLSDKMIAKLKTVEQQVHLWLDQNGWTDKNVAKAQKMKLKLMAS